MKSVDGRIQVLELDQPPFLPLFIPLAPAQPPVSISLYRFFSVLFVAVIATRLGLLLTTHSVVD